MERLSAFRAVSMMSSKAHSSGQHRISTLKFTSLCLSEVNALYTKAQHREGVLGLNGGTILKKVCKACKPHRTSTGSMSKQLICTSCCTAPRGDTKAAQAWGMSKPAQTLEFTSSSCKSKGWRSKVQMSDHLKVVMHCELWQEAKHIIRSVLHG